MNILFYFGHPAQFYFARKTIGNLLSDGHRIVIAIKTKDVLETLLKESGLPYVNIQPKSRGRGKLSIAWASVMRTVKIISCALANKIDVLVGTDASIAQAAFVLRKISITTLEDDADIIPNLAKVTFPFSTEILVPYSCDMGRWNAKKTGYAGFMKLAYLHPNVFNPDCEVPISYGIDISTPYFIVRFSALNAHHDGGIKGIDGTVANRIVEMLSGSGKVYITSEKALTKELEKYRLNINPLDIHHIMSFATLCIGDSQSMSVEAAMLGIPSVRFNDFAGKIGVLEELEHKYGLTFGIPSSEPQRLYGKIGELLAVPNLHDEFQTRRHKMLAEKIDVSTFLTWFLENYPASTAIMKNNPDYQFRFK